MPVGAILVFFFAFSVFESIELRLRKNQRPLIPEVYVRANLVSFATLQDLYSSFVSREGMATTSLITF